MRDLPKSLALLSSLLWLACAGSPAAPPAPAPAPTHEIATVAPTAPLPDADAGAASATSDAGPPARAPWPYATPVTVRSAKGMVVTDNEIASKVGRDVLAAGGNAA